MRIIVYHAEYGCDTGCCGHIVKVDGRRDATHFDFSHPDASSKRGEDKLKAFKEFAEQMVREHFGEDHVKDLDWSKCEVSDD